MNINWIILSSEESNPEKIFPDKINDTKTKTKKRTSSAINNINWNTLNQTIKEMAEIKRILDKENIDESEKIKLLESFFDIILNNSKESNKKKFLDIKKNKKDIVLHPEYAKFFEFENKDILPFNPRSKNFELIKLIKIYNWIINLKEKAEELRLIKKVPLILEKTLNQDFFDKNIAWTQYENIYLRMFGTEEKYDEILEKIISNQNSLSLSENKISNYRGFQDNMILFKPIKWYYSNFSLNILFSEEDFEEISGNNNVLGSHIPLTAINQIKQNDNKNATEETIRHESIHNIYWAFFDFSNKEYLVIFSNILKWIIRYKSEWNCEIFIQKELKNFRNQIIDFFKSSTEEILAEFGRIEEWKISTSLSNYNELILFIKHFIPNELRKSKRLSPNDVIEIEDEFIKILEDTVKEYKLIYKKLADFVFCCFNEWLKNDLFAVISIYWISKYKNIEKWLISKIWKEKYEYYEIMRSIIKPQFFKLPKMDVWSRAEELKFAVFNIPRTKEEHEIWIIDNPLNLENISRLWNSTPPAYFTYKENQNIIINWICKDDFDWVLEINHINTIDKLFNYIWLMEKLMKSLNIGEIETQLVIMKIIEEFEKYCFDESKKWNNKLLIDILDNLPTKYENVIKNIILTYTSEQENEDEEISKKAVESVLVILKDHPRSKKYF